MTDATMDFNAALSRGQEARTEDINQLTAPFVQPDAPLQPSLEFRSTPTRYARFPMVDLRSHDGITTTIQTLPAFHTETQFTPPVGKLAPASGFQVDNESQLHNRFFALNKRGSGIQNQYIPASDSDLYKDRQQHSQQSQQQPFPGLFKPYPKTVSTIVPDFVGHLKMSNQPMHNFTRQSVRYDATNHT